MLGFDLIFLIRVLSLFFINYYLSRKFFLSLFVKKFIFFFLLKVGRVFIKEESLEFSSWILEK